MPLPKLPKIPAKVQVGVDKVLVYLEPLMPKTKLPKTKNLLTESQVKKYREEFEMEMHERRLQVSSLRRGVVLSIPIDIDEKKFPYKINDIVSVPNETNSYDVINIDRTPLYIVGTRDIRLILPDISEEEAAKWNEDQERYLDEIVYYEEEKDSKVIAM
jgi:hypothetical protein